MSVFRCLLKKVRCKIANILLAWWGLIGLARANDVNLEIRPEAPPIIVYLLSEHPEVFTWAYTIAGAISGFLMMLGVCKIAWGVRTEGKRYVIAAIIVLIGASLTIEIIKALTLPQ